MQKHLAVIFARKQFWEYLYNSRFQSVWVSLPLRGFICLFVRRISSEARVVSMAFAKNYAFFMLILFPCSLHVVHALNYATFSAGNGNFMLHWTYSNNKLLFNMTCKATGWCAVGFTQSSSNRSMHWYDIAVGGVAAGASYLRVSLYILIVLFCSEVNYKYKYIVL